MLIVDDENRPFLTLDGRYSFFTSDRVVQDSSLEQLRVDLRPGNGSRDVYWVDARIIDTLRAHRPVGVEAWVTR